MDMDLVTVLDRYAQAWCTADADARAALLETCWSEHGVYEDPVTQAKGRKALSDYIGASHRRFPGMKIELTSGIDHHHDSFRFNWHLQLQDGTIGIKGVDFGTIAADGRLARITGFFGDVPEKSSA